jgi:hypothetical protein
VALQITLLHGMYNLLPPCVISSPDMRGRQAWVLISSDPLPSCECGPIITTLTVSGIQQATQKRDSGHVGMRRLVAGLVCQLGSLAVAAPPAQVREQAGVSVAHPPCMHVGCASSALSSGSSIWSSSPVTVAICSCRRRWQVELQEVQRTAPAALQLRFHGQRCCRSWRSGCREMQRERRLLRK